LLLDYSARITCSLGSSLTRKAERNPSEMKSNPQSRGVRGSLLPWRATQRGVETRPKPGCGRIGAAWPETGWHGAPPFRNPPRKRLLGGSAFDRTRLDAGSASRGAGTPFNRSSDENRRGNCFRAVGRGRLGERPSGRLCRSVHLGGPVCGSYGDLWVGSQQILEAAKLIFTAPGWAKTVGKSEDVQFVGSKAAMATLVWEAAGKPEKPNPGCVRMTVILTQKPEGWRIARVQATGLQPQSRSAAV
jgi:hypothetical protein